MLSHVDFIMIRVKTILGKIFSLKFSDKQLFSSVTEQFRPHDVVCPICGAKSSCSSHGFYSRILISIENGSRMEASISIPRVFCHSCRHTHAILSDVLIPYASYSLRFILTVLWKYLHRTTSVETFCNTWQISISTLYGWIHLFEKQGSLWLGILHKFSVINDSSFLIICSLEDFPSAFFSRFRFSFMQVYKTSASSRAPNST